MLNDAHEQEIPERTFHRHREGIADIFGIDIVCDRRNNNEYYIENPEILDENSFTSKLFSQLAIDNRLLDNRELADRVVDEKTAAGTSFLPLIIDAMQQKLRIDLTYRSQFSGKTLHTLIEPQFLKRWRQIWYVVAKHSSGIVTPFALDRFVAAELSDSHFDFDAEINPADYFSDVIGVNLDSDYRKERVLVKVKSPQRNYLDRLPLHHSQRAVETTDSHTIYEYHLCAEYEFQHEILRMGESAEVLQPLWLRHEIKKIAGMMHSAHQ